MIKQFGDHNWRQLRIPETPEFLPRRTRYGDDGSWSNGLTPIAYQDKVSILEWGDLKSALDKSHEDQSQPMYFQRDTWLKEGERYSQGNIGYCWTFAGTACMADCRAAEGKETVQLSAVSMGYLVGWKDRGNYLESYINGVRDTGVASVEYVDGDINSTNRNPDTYKDGWKEDRKNYRLAEIWDTDARSGDRTMILHCATILALTARPIHGAWNWWGHSVELCGMRFDESLPNNVAFILRNSHNEDDFLELTGSRAVPDEAYAYVSTVLA